MLPFHYICGALVAASGLAFLLPAQLRLLVWLGLLLLFLALLAWASLVQNSKWLGPCIREAGEGAGAGAGNRVALTYDDGPDPETTPALLELLAQRQVRATFFQVGEKVLAHPEVAQRCAAEGHLIGNHSHRHALHHNLLPLGRMRAELCACQEAIEKTTGQRPRYHRPPYGLRNHATHRAAKDCGLLVVGWQTGGMDTTSLPAEQIAARILAGIRPGGIVLLHDSGLPRAKLLAVTEMVLDGLQAKGLEPLRLDELL